MFENNYIKKKENLGASRDLGVERINGLIDDQEEERRKLIQDIKKGKYKTPSKD